jgi:hypothetical protein
LVQPVERLQLIPLLWLLASRLPLSASFPQALSLTALLFLLFLFFLFALDSTKNKRKITKKEEKTYEHEPSSTVQG